MLKRIGVLALLLSAAGIAVTPKVVFAQDGYYGPRNDYSYYGRDREDRHRDREWREPERRERRAEEWREHAWRDRDGRRDEWRDRDWRYRNDYRYGRAYSPGAYFGFTYRP